MSIESYQYTERALKVLSLARIEAEEFNHTYIGTEHLLLGHVREGDGVSARFLLGKGLDLPKIRRAVDFIIGRGTGVVMGEVNYTPRVKKVLHLANTESQRLHDYYIGTEHLLLGMLLEGDGIACGILQSLGQNPKELHAELEGIIIDIPSGISPEEFRLVKNEIRKHVPLELLFYLVRDQVQISTLLRLYSVQIPVSLLDKVSQNTRAQNYFFSYCRGLVRECLQKWGVCPALDTILEMIDGDLEVSEHVESLCPYCGTIYHNILIQPRIKTMDDFGFTQHEEAEPTPTP